MTRSDEIQTDEMQQAVAHSVTHLVDMCHGKKY